MESGGNASVGLIATYPPTVCGIATYTSSLVQAVIKQSRSRLGVVSLTDEPLVGVGQPVEFHHRLGDAASLRTAIRVLNTYDTVSIQHEFGIFGARDGREVLDLMAGLEVPTAVTLHTVLAEPTSHQRDILGRVCAMADRIVVMSETASERLADRYDVEPHLIRVIPHGVHEELARPSLRSGDRPLILTWGLIGPGKGLEWAIDAVARLTDMKPPPRYVIAGATHPRVRAQSGESYRHSLASRARRAGVERLIEFDNRYLSRRQLARLVRSADVVMLPYESLEQVTSGVLVEAIAAAKPVVATPFPHAVELLSDGAGVLVPYGDPEALGDALRRLIADPATRASMARRARGLAADWSWKAVAGRFLETMSDMAAVRRIAATPPLIPHPLAG